MKKLKAGALQLVTFVVVVIALLLSSFILLIHIHKQFRIKTNHTIETVALVNKGVKAVLHDKIILKDTVSINLYDEAYKSLKVHSSFWGSFEKVYAKAKIKNKTISKVALIGAAVSDKNAPALYLSDYNKPLVLVGNTKINGFAFLPKRGVKSGNISGQSYYGERYIYGHTSVSKDLPKLDSKLLNNLEELKTSTLTFPNIEYVDLNSSKAHKNSFNDPLQLVYSTSDIFLSDRSLTGHIIIQSETKITIDSTANIVDVILIAPIVEIAPNVVGTFQAIATERINVGKNVRLSYPSALVLQRDYVKDTLNDSKTISIADHTKITGQILALGSTQPSNNDVQIKLSANAIIEGVIYCKQNLELRGTVYGSVYTNNFIIKEGGSVYQNHLYNAHIDNSQLKPEFVGIGIENSKKGIAKWLY